MKLLAIVVLGVAGVVLIYAGSLASAAHDPTTATWDGVDYTITASDRGDFDLSHEGHSIGSVGGSTDTLCDQPDLRRYDVDGDGTDDLVVYNCGRFRAYTVKDRKIVDLAFPGRTLWANEIEWRGQRLGVTGAALFAVGIGAALRRSQTA